MVHWLNRLLAAAEGDLPPEKYHDYLIQWRLSLWQSIRHKELLIWSFIGFYAAAVGIIVGVRGPALTPPLELGIILLLSLLGFHVVLDANLWNTRNLFTISRIEKIFLRGQEGILIPRGYLDPPYRFNKIYSMHLQIIGLVALLAYARFSWGYLIRPCCAITSAGGLAQLTGGTLGALSILLLLRKSGDSDRQTYFDFRKAFEKGIDGTALPGPSETDKNEAALSDPSWIISRAGMSVVLAIFNLGLAFNTKIGRWFILGSIVTILVFVGYILFQVCKWSTKPDAESVGRLRCVNHVLVVSSGLILGTYLIWQRQFLTDLWEKLTP